MNKNYLLRGIGIGIIIGVVIMFAAWKTAGNSSAGKPDKAEVVTEEKTTEEVTTEAPTEEKTTEEEISG